MDQPGALLYRFQANLKKSLPRDFFSLFLTYCKKGSCKFLLERLLPLLKEMRFIVKKALSNIYQST